ncbi:MAG: hypothetical protein HOK84_09365 [Bacteroidetes bacterium]|nr:hypothetical protein [Bacteroidota bacterium]MBT5426392.1 hypothetical protein [Bacteroidota bacterium]
MRCCLSGVLRKNLFIIGIGLMLFASGCSYLPEVQNLSDTVHVEENRDYIIITPNREWYSMTGLVFYPGGNVDPHSYVEALSRFAVSGLMHQIVIVKMPANLAILNAEKGKWIYDDFSYVKRWVLAGHSLGGVSACRLVHEYPSFFFGLALLAAYPQESSDINWWSQTVLSIRGEHDALVSEDELDSNANFLPPAIKINTLEEFPMNQDSKTVYYTIPGGNHAYFGQYGDQKGDGEATITREKQIKELVNILQLWFDAYNWDE